MAHIRKQIRDYVASLIVGSELCGDNVDTSRAKPKKRDSPNSAHVYTAADQSSDISRDGTQQRIVRLKIDAVAKGDDDDLQDRFDDFGVHVETEMANDPRLNNLAAATEYKGTSFGVNVDGESPFGVMTISYDVTVLTLNSDPQTAL